MNPNTSHDNDKAKKLKVLWITCGFALAILAPVLLVLLSLMKQESALADTLASLEAAGVPISPVELNRRYHEHGHDPLDNAAPVYQQAFAAMDLDNGDLDVLRQADTEQFDRETLDGLAAVVERNRRAIDLFIEAAALPYLRYDLDFTEGPNLLLPHISSMRQGARLLAADAIVASHYGNSETAAEALLAAFHMARHLGEEPTTISYLSARAFESTAKVALVYALSQNTLSAASLSELIAVLDELDGNNRLITALHGEIVFGITVYQMLERDARARETLLEEDTFGHENVLFPLYQISGRLARDQQTYLSRMTEFLQYSALAPFRRRNVTISTSSFNGEIIAKTMVPTMHSVFERDVVSLTSLRATIIGLAAEQYRIEHGAFPSQLEDLIPDYLDELPRDPYASDFKFEWIEEKDAILIQSQGKDRRGSPENLNIHFRLPIRE